MHSVPAIFSGVGSESLPMGIWQSSPLHGAMIAPHLFRGRLFLWSGERNSARALADTPCIGSCQIPFRPATRASGSAPAVVDQRFARSTPMARKPLSKRVRFEIFKRDQFTCQYCGQTPPAVVLEIDHIVSVANGGSDDHTNLITACFDCNRGKGNIHLANRASVKELRARQKLIKERIDQALAFDAMTRERRALEDGAIDEVIAVYERSFDGWTLKEKTRSSIRNFLRKLPRSVVVEAMENACSRTSSEGAFKYFCGICWNIIKER